MVDRRLIGEVPISVSSELVVIVDDSLTTRKILERLVQTLGDSLAIQSFAAPDGALNFCREQTPDLLVVAERIAGRPIADFIRTLRSESAGADVPILLSATGDDRDGIDHAHAAGADDHLLAPFDPREFRTRVQSLLRLRDARRQAREMGEALEARRVREERRQQEGLNQAHEALLRVIDFIPAMICVTGRDGRYIFVNNRFASFVGVRANRLIGKRPAEAHGDPLARCLMESDTRLLAGEMPLATFEEEILDHDGKRRVLLTTKSILHGTEGDSSMLVTVFLDITSRKRTELDLLSAKEQAELANRSKTEFLSTMSHELRTPLNAIIGFSEMIQRQLLGPIGVQRYLEYASHVYDSGVHLLVQVKEMLDLSEAESGKLILSRRHLKPGGLLSASLEELRPVAIKAGVELQVTGDLASWPAIDGDAEKLQQSLTNIIHNAIKFTPTRGTVRIAGDTAGEFLRITVTDTGIGIRPEELPLVVRPFHRRKPAFEASYQGVGLGLPFAKTMFELHGGSLAIHSTQGIGTTVMIELPLAVDAALHDAA